MKKVRAKAAPSTEADVHALRHVVASLVAQMSVAMETLTLLRADQVRILEQLRMDGGVPSPHRCDEPEPPPTRKRAKTGGRRG